MMRGMSDDDRINDLMEMMGARFDDTNARIDSLQKTLDGLESKEHASSEVNHLEYRIQTIETTFEKTKRSIWRTVSAISGFVAFLVTTLLTVIQLGLL